MTASNFFQFLTPQDYGAFFKILREGGCQDFASHLDVALDENGQNTSSIVCD
jgi:hypothetical protein